MSTLIEHQAGHHSPTTSKDARLTEFVRSHPLDLVHAAMRAPDSTFTPDDLDRVSDAVCLEAIDTVATWSAEAAALHDFYRRHHGQVTSLRELIGEGSQPVSETQRLWAARTGADRFDVRNAISLTQAAVIGEWWMSMAQGSIAAKSFADATSEINSAAEALVDVAWRLEDSSYPALSRVASRLEKIDEHEGAKLRRILPDMISALRDTRLQLEREVVFLTSQHRHVAARGVA